MRQAWIKGIIAAMYVYAIGFGLWKLKNFLMWRFGYEIDIFAPFTLQNLNFAVAGAAAWEFIRNRMDGGGK